MTSLISFCQNGNLEAAKYAFNLSKPCKSILEDAMFTAATYGRLRVLKWLVKRGVQLSNLHLGQAARFGHFRMFRWMLLTFPKLDVHECFDYPLRHSCYFGHLKIFKWIWVYYPPSHCLFFDEIFKSTCSIGHDCTAKKLWRLRSGLTLPHWPTKIYDFCKRRSLQLISFY
jgi:hypothetical protein